MTDPSPEFPLGRTPADLASGNGHKGISGFLAESTLTSYLESLTMNDPQEDGTSEASGAKVVQTVLERTATPINDSDVPDVLSLRDSLTAVCNATQAADRIHQVFRMQSFQRKQLTEYGDDEFGISDERAVSLIAAKTRKSVQGDGRAHAAAIHIQKKFRGWKRRKEFLLIRQRIVKIQVQCCFISLFSFFNPFLSIKIFIVLPVGFVMLLLVLRCLHLEFYCLSTIKWLFRKWNLQQ